MTCAVPLCEEQVTMEGVCSAHWLEADEVAHGAARLDAALEEAHQLQREKERRERAHLERMARLRELAPDRDRQDRVFRRIVDKFWQEAAGESGRNRALAGAAWAAGRLVAGGELDGAEVTNTLISEGERCGLPHHEAKYVVTRQMERARQRPRALERSPMARVDLKVKL